jgi:hypothetical protein
VVGDGLLAQHQVTGDFLAGAALGHTDQDVDLPIAEIVRVGRTALRRHRDTDLERVGQLRYSAGEGLHAKLEEDGARLLHQFDRVATVALAALGDQHASIVEVRAPELWSYAHSGRHVDGRLKMGFRCVPSSVDAPCVRAPASPAGQATTRTLG